MATELSLWNETPAKQAIVDYLVTVTDPTSPNFVPEVERIAAFDNDGTLWCEQPVPVQVAGALEALAVAAAQDPGKREQQPFKAAYERDMAWFGQYMTNEKIPELIGMLLKAGAGETQEEFEARVSAWFAKARHPRFGVPYTKVAFKPMAELLSCLRQNGFKVFICSGGGMDFMRLVSEETYGVPREYVVGSNMKLSWEQRDGTPVLVRQAGIIEPFNDGTGKPINIQLHAGRPPILTGGNSDGDVAMMEFAAASGKPYLNLLIHHDDAEREYAYTRSAENALAAAGQHGWTVVSMKDDWKTVFP
jgi:phosphoglycolate phosphatase-like HAD superfamily hydrolase